MKKRVLMLVPSLGMGGMERVCVNYANLLSKRGYRVTLLNLTFDSPEIIGELCDEVEYHNNVAVRMPNIVKAGPKRLFRGSFRLRPFSSWIRTSEPSKVYRSLITSDPDRYDIEIAFYGGMMMRILSGSLQRKSVKLGWIHSPTIERHFSAFASPEDAVAAYRSMDMLVCVSREISDRAKALFGSDVNAEVINNPNNTARIREKSLEPVTDIQKKRFTFINASRIDIDCKGYDRLAEAVARLRAEGEDFEVWILGDGKDSRKLEALVSEKGLGDVIRLLGRKSNPFCYIRLADCYICSSRHEGFSMVVAEAIILGTPVVTTDISGASEMLGDSEYGLITENSEEGIYRGMKKMLSEPGYYEYIRSRARLRMDWLSEDRITDKLEDCFERLLRTE